MYDIFEHLLWMGGVHNRGYFSQCDFQEAITRLGIRGDRNSMERVYLFFRRYNIRKDDMLTRADLLEVFSPIDKDSALALQTR